MPLLPAFFLLAQGSRTEVVLHHRRPSAVVASLRGMGASLAAHDDRGVVEIEGTPAEVASARDALRLADSPRKTLRVRVSVESPVDHLSWEVDARLSSGQRWRTADGETGAEVALEPRVDASGNLVVKVLARCAGNEVTSILRLHKGRSSTLTLGAQRTQRVDVADGPTVTVAETAVPLPKVTVRYVGG